MKPVQELVYPLPFLSPLLSYSHLPFLLFRGGEEWFNGGFDGLCGVPRLIPPLQPKY
jgi:hypothetical protein